MSTLEVKAIQAPSGFDLQMPAGHILQTVSTTYNTQTNIASSTYTATGLSLSITPSSTSSKILLLWDIPAELYVSDLSERVAYFQSYRDSTVLVQNLMTMEDVNRTGHTMSGSKLDSPASTSSITYSIKAKVNDTSSSCSVQVQRYGLDSNITLMEVAG